MFITLSRKGLDYEKDQFTLYEEDGSIANVYTPDFKINENEIWSDDINIQNVVISNSANKIMNLNSKYKILNASLKMGKIKL